MIVMYSTFAVAQDQSEKAQIVLNKEESDKNSESVNQNDEIKIDDKTTQVARSAVALPLTCH